MESEFKTFNNYLKRNITASMEDYLEMIYRLSLNKGFTRLQILADNLNVSAPSASKMIQKLAQMKLLKYQKYGYLYLEESGKVLGKELLDRHNTIAKLLEIIGIKKENILIETEKIEHTLSEESLLCIKEFISKEKKL